MIFIQCGLVYDFRIFSGEKDSKFDVPSFMVEKC